LKNFARIFVCTPFFTFRLFDCGSYFSVPLVSTLKSGGNILIPSRPSGLVYDLVETLHSYLSNVGMSLVPIYFISPVSEKSLAYSNILGEWMSKDKQDRIYLPEPPLLHPELIRIGRLFPFVNISDGSFGNAFKTPCIVFCGHPSLRFGDALHFIRLWGSNQKNTLLMIDPEFDPNLALGPFQPLSMKFGLF